MVDKRSNISYGPVPKARVIRLLKALLQEVIGHDRSSPKDLSWEWETDSSTPVLKVWATTQALKYIYQRVETESDKTGLKDFHKIINHYLRKRESGESIPKFLNIWEEPVSNERKEPVLNERKSQDNSTFYVRHFKLYLWSKTDIQTNLEEVKKLWDQKQPSRGKRFPPAVEVLPEQKEPPQPSEPRKIRPSRLPEVVKDLPQWVDRPEHIDAVKQLLLDGRSPDTVVISALYGMGGIGKSTLVKILIKHHWDEALQERFPDGVLWVTLGQTPNLAEKLTACIRQLGDHYNARSEEDASTYLGSLLSDKKTLLVIDDLWREEHLTPFRITGAGCQLLATSRHTKISGAETHELNLMTSEQALEMLKKYSSQPLHDSDRAQAEEFAREVGYLPLALELGATLIKSEYTWEELLADLKAEIANLQVLDLDDGLDWGVEVNSLEAHRKRRSLVASFKLTLKKLKPKLLQQFAWLGVIPEDVELTPAMGQKLWDVSLPKEATKVLRKLRSCALLLPPTQGGTYRVHDLLHKAAKNLLTREIYLGDLAGLGMTLPQAHQQLLNRYQKDTQGNQWHTLSDDGYIHRYLGWHFEKAQLPNLLHSLLQETTEAGRNGWYEACNGLGQLDAFVSDVDRAWRLADEAYQQSLNPNALVLQLRYALITSTITSLANNMSPRLVGALVEKKFWSPTQGWAYVQRLLDISDQVEGIRLLAPFLSESLKKEALKVAHSIKPEPYRIRALSALATLMSTEDIRELFKAIYSLETVPERTEVLVTLAQHAQIPEETIETFLDNLPGSKRIEVFLDLAKHVQMPKKLIETFLCNLPDEFSRAKCLVASEKRLEPHLISQHLDSLLGAARHFEQLNERIEINLILAPIMSKEDVEKVLEICPTDFQRIITTETLVNLIPYLSSEHLEKTFEYSRRLSHYNRVRIFAALAPMLLKDNIQRDISEIFKFLVQCSREFKNRFPYDSKYFKSLGIIASNLHSECAKKLFDELFKFRDGKSSQDLIAFLVPHLSSIEIGKAVDNMRIIQDGDAQDRFLIMSLPNLPVRYCSKALDTIQDIQPNGRYIGFSRLEPFVWLAPRLSPEHISRFITLFQGYKDQSDFTSAIILLSPYLLPEHEGKLIKILKNIYKDNNYTQIIFALSPYLSPESSLDLLDFVLDFETKNSRISVLVALTQNILLSKISEARDTCFDEKNKLIKSRTWTERKIKEIGIKLPNSVISVLPYIILLTGAGVLVQNLRKKLSEAISIFLAKNSSIAVEKTVSGFLDVLNFGIKLHVELQGISRHKILPRISRHQFPNHIISETKRIYDVLMFELKKIDAIIVQLASKLSLEQSDRILEAYLELPDDFLSAKTLGLLASNSSSANLFKTLSRALRCRNEVHFTEAIVKLIPYLSREDVPTLFEAALSLESKPCRIIILCQLYAYLFLDDINTLFDELLRKGLLLEIRICNSKGSYLSILTFLLPCLTVEQIDKVIDTLFCVEDEEVLLKSLSELAPYLTSEQIDNIFHVILVTQNGKENFSWLSDLQRLNFVQWSKILHFLGKQKRSTLLKNLPSLQVGLVKFSGKDLTPKVVEIVQEVCRQWP